MQTATQRFDAAVREQMSGGTPRQRAVLIAARRRPDLHRAFLLETNAAKCPKVMGAVAIGSRQLHPAVARHVAKAADTARIVPAAKAAAPAPAPKPEPTGVDPLVTVLHTVADHYADPLDAVWFS